MQRWSRSRKALKSQSSIYCCSPKSPLPRWSFQCVRSNSTEASTKVSRRIIFSGIQPTGVPHLGNYLGAIRPWVQLQKEKTSKDVLNISIVDLHALTIPQDPEQLKKWRLDTYLALLAVGLDPQISRIFYQSEVGNTSGNSNLSIAYTSR
jgi:tRNA synthetases class I (W and Y)